MSNDQGRSFCAMNWGMEIALQMYWRAKTDSLKRTLTVTPTDRPKSVRKCCVIKVFGGVFMLSRCFLDCSVGVWVFVTGLSQISSFFS